MCQRVNAHHTHLSHLKLYPPDCLSISNGKVRGKRRMPHNGGEGVAVLVGEPFAAEW